LTIFCLSSSPPIAFVTAAVIASSMIDIALSFSWGPVAGG
jgi:multisubunit Na+/H+ antiporter MnhB subunit